MVKERLNQRFFTILLALEILYLAVALLIPPLPGWKMFSRVEWVHQDELRDDRGNLVSLEGFMPSTHYEWGAGLVQNVATFVCQKHPEIPEWTLKVEGETYGLQARDCLPRKK